MWTEIGDRDGDGMATFVPRRGWMTPPLHGREDSSNPTPYLTMYKAQTEDRWGRKGGGGGSSSGVLSVGEPVNPRILSSRANVTAR